MAVSSTLRSRRLAKRQRENTQQIIAFQLRQTWFALPLEAVSKVFQVTDQVSLPPLLDTEEKLFLSSSDGEDSASNAPQNSFVLMVKTRGGYFGIVTPHPPKMERVPDSAMNPLSEPDALTVAPCITATVNRETDPSRWLLIDAMQL